MDKGVFSIIGRNIRAFRENRGITQSSLAKECGLTRASISQIEQGKQKLSIDSLYTLVDVLGCTAYDLLPPDKYSDVDVHTMQNINSSTISRVINSIDREIDKRG